MESSFWSEPITQPCHLRTFADANSRLMRWSLRLSEFDLIVEHRPGIKIKHVDALSRHVAAIMQDGVPSKEEILAEQRKDPFCKTRKLGTHSSKSEYFLDDNGVLYKRRSDHKHQLVAPKSLVEDIIKANHDPVYVAHPGTKRTIDLISLNYWWPSMRKSVEDYIRKCDSCTRRKEERVCGAVRENGGAFIPFRSHIHGHRGSVFGHTA